MQELIQVGLGSNWRSYPLRNSRRFDLVRLKRSEMNCFYCFLPHQRKTSKRIGSRNRRPVVHRHRDPSPRRWLPSRSPPRGKRAERTYNKMSLLFPIWFTFDNCGCSSILHAEKVKKVQNEAASQNTAENTDEGNKNIAAHIFTFRELAAATKNFRHECLLGEGGFGRVYKGRLEKTGQVLWKFRSGPTFFVFDQVSAHMHHLCIYFGLDCCSEATWP